MRVTTGEPWQPITWLPQTKLHHPQHHAYSHNKFNKCVWHTEGWSGQRRLVSEGSGAPEGKPSFSGICSSSQAGLTGCPLLGCSSGALGSVEKQWERSWPLGPPQGTAVCFQNGVMSLQCTTTRSDKWQTLGMDPADVHIHTHTHTSDLIHCYSPRE